MNWSAKTLVFGAVTDWHIPSLTALCKKRAKLRNIETCPLWENPDIVDNLKLDKLMDNHWPIVRSLTTQKDALLIDKNWKFRDDVSIQWIQSQCQSGMAFGAFPPDSKSDDVNEEPIAWIVAYK